MGIGLQCQIRLLPNKEPNWLTFKAFLDLLACKILSLVIKRAFQTHRFSSFSLNYNTISLMLWDFNTKPVRETLYHLKPFRTVSIWRFCCSSYTIRWLFTIKYQFRLHGWSFNHKLLIYCRFILLWMHYSNSWVSFKSLL